VNSERKTGDFTVNESGYRFTGNGPFTISGTLSVNKDVAILVPLSIACPINVADGAWFKLGASASATNTVLGHIVGEHPAGAAWPTNTHFLAERYSYGSSPIAGGGVKIDTGAGVTNDVGTLSVRSSLTVASGVVRVSSGKLLANDNSGETDGGSALVLVGGNGSTYDSAYGHLVVGTGAEIATPAETWNVAFDSETGVTNGVDRYAQANRYAQIEVYGRIWMPNVEWIHSWGSPATLTIGAGGDVCLGTLNLNRGSDAGSTVNLNAGGTLRLRNFTIRTSAAGHPCSVNFDGGAIHPLPAAGTSINKGYFLGVKNDNSWKRVTLNVLAGGAVFETTEETAYCNRPFTSGVAAGETDGGLIVRGGNGKVLVLTVAGSDYNGPTVIEGGQLQVRVANGLPTGTTLKLGAGAIAGFNTYATSDPADVAQTVARVEGIGSILNNSGLVVTGGIAPAYAGHYGTNSFHRACSLSGTLDITGDANGCGCVEFQSAGQSLAGLTLRVADASAFAKDKGKSFYKVVDAPKGYSDSFAAVDLPSGWEVRYEDKAVYLRYTAPTVLSMR
jgi:hypothetical protein